MAFKTEVLNFSIGGFSGGYERIIWQNDKLYHHFDGNFVEGLEEDFTIPSTKDWEEFWDTVDTLKVWSWKKHYNNDDVLDGTQWELTIKREGRRKRRIFGSNAYPEPKGTFESFVKALSKLSKSEIEFKEEDF
tara:strand:- start:151 stop:549 length:399 start_codon:yes stop_codon:yes gene_type:complete